LCERSERHLGSYKRSIFTEILKQSKLKMKKIILTVFAVLCVQFVGFSQKSEEKKDEKVEEKTPYIIEEEEIPLNKKQDFNGLQEQLQKMQREMLKMFGGGDSDSSGISLFKFGSPNMQMDSSFSKSFGGIFDGKEWKSMMPGDSTMGDMMRQFQDKMPDFGKNFDMSEMLKGFGNMFGNSPDNMPRVEPKQKQRSEEGDKKNKKYKTESL
jgi:hypothetical protein